MTRVHAPTTRRTKTVAILLGLLMAHLVTAPPSRAQSAGSIVFVVDDNIWIMAGDDAATARPVTTDGTPANPYNHPSQDDTGRIMAVRGPVFSEQTLVLMDQAGAPLQPPLRPSGYEGIEELSGLDLTPTGDAVALDLASTQCGAQPVCGGSDLQATDGSGSLVRDVLASGASWYSSTQVVAGGDSGEFTTYEAGADAQEVWFASCEFDDPVCITGGTPEIDRGLTRLVANQAGSDFLPPTLSFWTLNGAPPAEPTVECSISETGGSYYTPSWSPDGTGLVVTYGEGVFGEAPVKTAGIYTFDGFGAASCESLAASEQLLVEGAYHADWSPAPLGAAPGQPADPPPTGPPGRDLVDGERIDGGGQADPIGQAVTTSQLLFADGAADRVVLSTADRFPDALAGAALAGNDGPILYTSGLGPLDDRTRAEIARVTGGDGVVLTLGGDQAVSEEAAAQARSAGGDRPCSAPLPSTCRYAGAAREQTAALISATVLAEHPGATALIARRDDFADAITGGAYAARAGVPILITASTSLHPDTAAFLQDNGITTSVVLGGTAAIDQATFDSLPTANNSRVAGAERTATSVAVARDLWAANGLGQGGGALLVNVRDGAGWQTALAAAVASAVHDAPQLGVESPPAGLSPAVSDYLGQVSGPVVVFGDPALVSEDQLAQARG